MNISKTETEQGPILRLSGEADLRDAAEIRAALLACLDSRCATVIDLLEIERPDVSLLQLVCSAQQTFRAVGIPLSVLDAGAFDAAWSQAGFLKPKPEAAP